MLQLLVFFKIGYLMSFVFDYWLGFCFCLGWGWFVVPVVLGTPTLRGGGVTTPALLSPVVCVCARPFNVLPLLCQR